MDPARGMDEVRDVCMEGDRIVPDFGKEGEAEQVIPADGCLVLPGLIDFHAHVFYRGNDSSVPPDLAMIPNGVTTVLDGGTAGTANYESFYRNVMANSVVRIKSLLSVSPTGQSTVQYDENQDPRYFDEDRMEQLFRRYPDSLIGLKVRQSRDVVGGLGLSPFKRALKVADRLSCRVEVHTTDSPGETTDLVNLFRPGDIFTHVFHGIGNTIIGRDGHVLPAVREARKRGVIFDAANGRNHFAFKTAEAALADGFAPDVLGSDLTWLTFGKEPAFGLPWLMSKYLALGMKLPDVIAAVTATPARVFGMEKEIGTLAPGACADVALFKLVRKKCTFRDILGESRTGEQLLLPQATWRAGRLVFRQLNF